MVPGAMSVQSLPLLLQELGLEPRGLLENESRAEGKNILLEGNMICVVLHGQ
jgi:hypothetical protein